MNINYQPLSKMVTEDDIVNFKQKNVTKKLYFPIKQIPVIFAVNILALMAVILVWLLGVGSIDVIKNILYADVLLSVGTVIFVKTQKSSWEKYIKLFNFAESNGFTYRQTTSNPPYEGMIFGVGDNRRAYDQLSCQSSNCFFEIANYTYTKGSGDDQERFYYGYIIIKLERNMPHMVLDSNKNNAKFFGINLSNLPIAFDKNQKLSLEGDFNEHFTLYAPKEYERDALYVFTPNLMALFIDESGYYDAEIIEDGLFIYSNNTFNLLDEKVLQRIFKIINTVGAKLISQTDRYADERTGDRSIDVVAKPGQRLKKQLPWIMIIFGVLFILLFIIILMKY